MQKSKSVSGFTLIEILVVIGIIAILAAIVIIAINPAKQFAQARNSQRTANVNAILNAIGQRIADNKGVFEGQFVVGPDTFKCAPLLTGASVKTDMAADITTATGNLGCLVPTYIPQLPRDPKAVAANDTEYTITLTGSRVKICAPNSASPASEPSLPDAPAICVER